MFTACVVQRLLYGLDSAWLNKKLLSKLNGFYCRCLRRILKISPSHISRVSNAYVLQQFQSKSLSHILLYRQLILFGKIARMPDNAVMRKCVFKPQSIDLIVNHDRKQGRPRNAWATELHKQSLLICADSSLENIIMQKEKWQHSIKSHIKAMTFQ